MRDDARMTNSSRAAQRAADALLNCFYPIRTDSDLDDLLADFESFDLDYTNRDDRIRFADLIVDDARDESPLRDMITAINADLAPALERMQRRLALLTMTDKLR